MAKTKSQTKVEEVISKGEFEAFKKATEETQSKMLDFLEKIANKDSLKKDDVVESIQNEEIKHAKQFGQDQYSKIVDKYFDPSDGFVARIVFPSVDAKENGGLGFELIVPDKFSNASEAHRKFYKKDVRYIPLNPANIIQGINAYCAKVAKNLKYDKRVKIK